MKELEAMTAKAIKPPGPDHPIAIEPNPKRVLVSIAGRTIAERKWRPSS